MDKKLSCGIIGRGFVGGTCYDVFSKVPKLDVKVYDRDDERCLNSFEETAACDVVFVCLPTPMDKDTGECDISLIEEAVRQIRQEATKNLIVIKSTVQPGTTTRLNREYGRVCFNPEFLTEANAYGDFVSLPYQIVGSPDSSTIQEAKRVYIYASECGILRNHQQLYVLGAIEAEMVKYTRNCYLATRLSFFNEIKQICDKLGANFDEVKHIAGLDPRVGKHYNNVFPENPGWGLGCLPKDLNGLKYLAEVLGVDPKVLDAVWEKNLEVRKFRDWEEMEKAVKKS